MIVCGRNWNPVLALWIAGKVGGSPSADRSQYIGWVSGDKIVAVVQFADCNEASVMLHCAGEGKNWLSREFLWFVFWYAFRQLQVRKIISPVEGDNTKSRRFIEHIGFSLEATLADCSPTGDLLLYTMSADTCRWLNTKRGTHGQAQSPSAA